METQQSNSLPDINQTVTFKAPILKVWDAVSTAQGLSAWFMPNDLEAVVGHEFKIDAGPFGIQACLVKEVEAPNRISFGWGKDWTITILLKDLADNQTECTLIHAGWKTDIIEHGMPHALIRDRMNEGWIGLQSALGKYVEA
ncbi:SRPBCC family protein [Paenibacillus albus]|uniref:SRPBCC domain-containing protein n=1 Tax=Paenibacillus albus TaxID=2495582 RepID=A0A3S9A7Y1_9BACL|nr:SRPBCC domain-containing protein [Paenibacillus albus]AZN41855.1 SRPBCC domain-containing protein [Paenibacillus albus]